MTSERLRFATARSGHMNVEVDGAPYHSPYNPQREAQKFYGTYAIENADIIVHFGWGLGYAEDVLIDRIKPSARVVVLEPDQELFKESLRQRETRKVFQDSRFKFVVGPSVCQFFDEWPFAGCQETDEFLWLVWPAAFQRHRTLVESLRQNFTTRLRDRAGNLLTHLKNGKLYFENVLSNFEYLGDADAGSLFGRFSGVPLVIVSAGPSLDRNIHDLRGAEDRCFILAVDTALRPLLAAGVLPHAVIIADPTELNAGHIAGIVPESTYLIAEQAVHSSALRSASRRFLFGLGLFPDSLFAKFGLARSPLQVWGSVATAALDLACRIGANPVIFAGQDFAYSWDRDYASNTIFEGNAFDVAVNGTHRMIDVWGQSVRTSENLIAYRDFFMRKIRQTPEVHFVNATEGGILTEGVEILSLRDALHQYCQRKLSLRFPSPVPRSAGNSDGRALNALSHLSEVLQSRSNDCDCLAGFLELAAKEALLRQDDEAVNRSILWAGRICEELLRTHAEGRAASAHRGYSRTGVDV
jgi:hypothetical protein